MKVRNSFAVVCVFIFMSMQIAYSAEKGVYPRVLFTTILENNFCFDLEESKDKASVNITCMVEGSHMFAIKFSGCTNGGCKNINFLSAWPSNETKNVTRSSVIKFTNDPEYKKIIKVIKDPEWNFAMTSSLVFEQRKANKSNNDVFLSRFSKYRGAIVKFERDVLKK